MLTGLEQTKVLIHDNAIRKVTEYVKEYIKNCGAKDALFITKCGNVYLLSGESICVLGCILDLGLKVITSIKINCTDKNLMPFAPVLGYDLEHYKKYVNEYSVPFGLACYAMFLNNDND